jgi:hypothetical protein
MMHQPNQSTNHPSCGGQSLNSFTVKGTAHPGAIRKSGDREALQRPSMTLFLSRAEAFDAVQSEKKGIFGDGYSTELSKIVDDYASRIRDFSQEDSIPDAGSATTLSEVTEMMPPPFAKLLTRFGSELAKRPEAEKIILAALETARIEQNADQSAWEKISLKLNINPSIRNAIELEAQRLMSFNLRARAFEGRTPHPRSEL